MKKKIIAIRERYYWESPYKIITSKNTMLRDRLFMIFMLLWFIPCKILFNIVRLLLYIPDKIFRYVDNQLGY